MENLTSKYLINGPNNAIRLTDGKKVLYIFGDYHMPTQYQQECPINDEYDSIDLDKLLLKFIKTEKNKEFDLFIEWDKFNPDLNNTFRNRYIDQIYKLFNSKILIKKNQIVSSKNFSNFRFHWFDIRSSIPYDNFFFQYGIYTLPFPLYLDNIEALLKLNKDVINNLELFIKYLNSNENHYINKIKNEYTDLKIKKIMNHLLKILIFDNIELSISNIIKINDYIYKNLKTLKDIFTKPEIKINIQTNIYFKMKNNMDTVSLIFVVLTDLYFIRRFLTKDYIKNGIIYTGSSHMRNITFILTTYFKFKITNIFYKNNKFSLKIITKLKTTNFDYLKVMKLNLDILNDYDNPIQCINLFNFPENFL